MTKAKGSQKRQEETSKEEWVSQRNIDEKKVKSKFIIFNFYAYQSTLMILM